MSECWDQSHLRTIRIDKPLNTHSEPVEGPPKLYLTFDDDFKRKEGTESFILIVVASFSVSRGRFTEAGKLLEYSPDLRRIAGAVSTGSGVSRRPCCSGCHWGIQILSLLKAQYLQLEFRGEGDCTEV